MASAIVHICVAKELNKKLKVEEKTLYLGSIAPDLSAEIKLDRNKSHFIGKNDKYPDIEKFVKKYKDHMNDAFVLGYFFHIYTDRLWIDFLGKTVLYDKIYNSNGENVLILDKPLKEIIYDDYTSLNASLIDKYKIDLSLFHEELELPDTLVDEIPIYKLDVIVDKTKNILKNSKRDNQLLLDESEIIDFINDSVKEIEEYLSSLE